MLSNTNVIVQCLLCSNVQIIHKHLLANVDITSVNTSNKCCRGIAHCSCRLTNVNKLNLFGNVLQKFLDFGILKVLLIKLAFNIWGLWVPGFIYIKYCNAVINFFFTLMLFCGKMVGAVAKQTTKKAKTLEMSMEFVFNSTCHKFQGP